MTGITTSTSGIDTTTAAQTASSTQEAEASNAEKVSSTTEIDTSKKETVEISTRAQKIKKLNDEFFPSGAKAFKITPEFINRLQEFGFISAGEADKFNGYSNDDNTAKGAANTMSELSLFIDEFTDDLTEVEPTSSLIDIFQQAKTVIDHFDAPTEESLSIDITKVAEQIKRYNETSTVSLSEEDKQSIDQLVLALSLANALNPGKNTSAEIDRYLEINNL